MPDPMPDPYDNCYVTEAEVAAYFENSALGLAFLEIDEPLQIGFLLQATRAIDSLPLRGEPYELPVIKNGVIVDANRDGVLQRFAFPRIIDGVVLDWDQALNKPIIPSDVRNACMEEALSLWRASLGGRNELREQGVASFNLGGKLQETFAPGAGRAALTSRTAKTYLRKYQGVEVH